MPRIRPGVSANTVLVPNAAFPAEGSAPTQLQGVYVTDITRFTAKIRWTSGGNDNGGPNPIWAAGVNYNFADFFTTTPTFNGTDYGEIALTGLSPNTSYTYSVWVSTDYGDGPYVNVSFTTNP